MSHFWVGLLFPIHQRFFHSIFPFPILLLSFSYHFSSSTMAVQGYLLRLWDPVRCREETNLWPLWRGEAQRRRRGWLLLSGGPLLFSLWRWLLWWWWWSGWSPQAAQGRGPRASSGSLSGRLVQWQDYEARTEKECHLLRMQRVIIAHLSFGLSANSQSRRHVIHANMTIFPLCNLQ